jgi:hypothetical protein
MPIVVPGPNNAQNNLNDATFIQKVRRILRDVGSYQPDKFPADGNTGNLAAGSKPFKLTQPPIMPGTVLITTANPPPGGWQVDYDDSPSDVPPPNHVNVITDTGELIFPAGAAPTSGTVAVTYKHWRYSDNQVKDALYEGLNMLWPELWNPVTNTTQVAISPTQFEYALQSLFQDQRAIILEVEYSPPSGFIRYYRTSLWRQLEDINNPTLIFSELPPISSIIRITYCTSFAALSSVIPQAQHLPVYYAVARLLADQETMRSRADDVPAQSPGENVAPPGSALSTAAYWLERFTEQLGKFALDLPARRLIADRSVEALGLSEFWTHVA